MSDTNDMPEPTGPPADWQAQLAARDQALAHANSELDKARKEAAGYRTGNKGAMAEAAKRLAKLIDVELPDDGPPDLNSLIDRLDPAKHADVLKAKDDVLKAKDGEIRSLKLDIGLVRAYSRHGAKEDVTRAFLDAKGHTKRLVALDPAQEDYQEAIDDAVGEVLVDAPELKASTIPIRSTHGDFSKPPPNRLLEQVTHEELREMSPEEVQAALRRGNLDSILGRRA